MRDRAPLPLTALLAIALACVLACGGGASPSATGGGASDDGGPYVEASVDAAEPTTDASVDATAAFDAGRPGDAGALQDGAPPSATPVQPLLPGTGFYPRAIALLTGSILVSVVAPQTSGRLGATLLESTDDALTFQVVGHIDDARAANGLCCGTLYQLPRAVGALAAGTLLWSASVGQNDMTQPMSLPIWTSVDRGHSWMYLSTVVTTAAPRTAGIWEPEFSLLDDGTLVCDYSDETDPAHSQKLTSRSSKDGLTWGSQADIVALTDPGARPGMANVRRPTGGDFFMSYEVCGVPSDDCTVHVRTSPDGRSWGPLADAGTRPATADGLVFRHAPTLAWVDAPGSSAARLYLVGQMVFTAAGATAPDNGVVLFENDQSGAGAWTTLAAPVPIPEAYDNYCPNYSSTLLPLDDGSVVLEVASRAVGTDCRPFFARGPLAVPSSAGQ